MTEQNIEQPGDFKVTTTIELDVQKMLTALVPEEAQGYYTLGKLSLKRRLPDSFKSIFSDPAHGILSSGHRRHLPKRSVFFQSRVSCN
jgi:hypothetical protein